MISPCFDKIGENNKFDLTELKVSGYEEDGATADEVYLDILTPGGATQVQYQFLDVPGDFEAGWYNGDYEPIKAGDCIVEAGEGIWVTGTEKFKFTFAGQVIEFGRGVLLRNGAIGIGNMLARSVDLTEIIIKGYEEVTSDEVYLDILTPGGATQVQYQYLDVPGDFEAGWYNGDYELITEGIQVFAPGEGMWVTGVDGYIIEFPDL